MHDENARDGRGFDAPLRGGTYQYQRVPDDADAADRHDHLRASTRAVFGQGHQAEMDILLDSTRNRLVYPARSGTPTNDLEDGGSKATEGCLLSPKDSCFLSFWDPYLAALLIVVAVLAPYETAFLVPRLDGLFVFNRFVDLCFTFDMILQFFIIQYDDTQREIRDPRKLASMYLSGWFWIDLASILPVDVYCVISGNHVAGGNSVRTLKVIRLFRLIRLLRLARVQRILNRLHTIYPLSFAILSLGKFMSMLLFVSHWMACVWGGLAMQTDDEANWLTVQREENPDGDQSQPSHVYLMSLYWAVMTFTSIGYGDITPHNFTEYLASTVCMLIMAMLWTYIIGSVCGIVGTLNPHQVQFQQMMDTSNSYMDELCVPRMTKQKIRCYLHEAKSVSRLQAESRRVFDLLSPNLQGEIYSFVQGGWLSNDSKVWLFRRVGQGRFLGMVAKYMRTSVYAPEDLIYKEQCLCFVRRGICFRKPWYQKRPPGSRGRSALLSFHVVTTGGHWGEDFMVSNPALRSYRPAWTAAYVELVSLHSSSMRALMSQFPEETRVLHKRTVFIALRNFILKASYQAGKLREDGEPAGAAAECFKDVCRKLTLDQCGQLMVSFMNEEFSCLTTAELRGRLAACVEVIRQTPASAEPALAGLGSTARAASGPADGQWKDMFAVLLSAVGQIQESQFALSAQVADLDLTVRKLTGE